MPTVFSKVALSFGEQTLSEQNRIAVMLHHLLLGLVENTFIPVMLLNAIDMVVALDDPSDVAEVFRCIHMGGCLYRLIHGEEGHHIAVVTVGQGAHEYIARCPCR